MLLPGRAWRGKYWVGLGTRRYQLRALHWGPGVPAGLGGQGSEASARIVGSQAGGCRGVRRGSTLRRCRRLRVGIAAARTGSDPRGCVGKQQPACLPACLPACTSLAATSCSKQAHHTCKAPRTAAGREEGERRDAACLHKVCDHRLQRRQLQALCPHQRGTCKGSPDRGMNAVGVRQAAVAPLTLAPSYTHHPQPAAAPGLVEGRCLRSSPPSPAACGCGTLPTRRSTCSPPPPAPSLRAHPANSAVRMPPPPPHRDHVLLTSQLDELHTLHVAARAQPRVERAPAGRDAQR